MYERSDADIGGLHVVLYAKRNPVRLLSARAPLGSNGY
jgi:hypothetical protein